MRTSGIAPPSANLRAARIQIAARASIFSMPSVGQYIFVGHSHARYVFEVYPLDVNFKDDFGAIYIFSRQTSVLTQIPIYIGETDQLGVRIRNHEKWPSIKRNDATHICVFADSRKKSRRVKAQDLLVKYDPACNLD
jgi:hypothetical protein